MRVKVYAPPFAKREKIDENNYLELQEGATLKEVFNLLEIPLPIGAVFLCRVNYEKADLGMTLQEGDVISFYFHLAGG